MGYFEDRQLTVIGQLKNQLSDLVFRTERRASTRLHRLKPKAEFYLNMQKTILNDPEIMDAWKDFLSVIRLSGNETLN